jgi:hypothetical protein
VVIISYIATAPLALGGTVTSYVSSPNTWQVHTFSTVGTSTLR